MNEGSELLGRKVQKKVVARLVAVHPVGLHGAGGGTAGTE